MKTRMFVALATAAGLLFSPLALSPAEAAARKSTAVTIQVSRSTVEAGTPITIKGKASPRKAGTVVKLQKRAGASWKTVKTDRLNRSRAYSFRVVASKGTNTFRVTAPKVRYAKAATSRAVAVTGKAGTTTPSTVPAFTPELLSQYQAKALAQLNAYRQANGKAPVQFLAGANELAQARAEAVYNGTSEPQLSTIEPFFSLMGSGTMNFCEGWDYTPANGPDTHQNPDYLIDAEYAAVGYFYGSETEAGGKPAVWTIYVMDAD